MGDVERARVAISAARASFDEIGDRVGSANAAWAAILLDPDPESADDLGRWAEAELRTIDSPFALAHCLEARALVDLADGRATRSGAWLLEAVEIFGRLRNSGCVAHSLEASAAHLAAAAPDAPTIALMGELLGAAEGLRAASGHRHRPWELQGQRTALASLRSAVDDDELDRLIAQGRAHRLESALELGRRALIR